MISSLISDCNFRSRVEREHAYFLEYERQSGRITAWRYELPYDLIVNEKTICEIIPDFTIWYPNGRVEINEIKGGQIFKTPQWSIKRKLFMALFPHIAYRVIDRFAKAKRGRTKYQKTWDKQAKRWVKFKPRIIQMDSLD